MTMVQERLMQGAARREYIAPQLVQYGSVSDLTATGSGNFSENNGNGKCAGYPGGHC